MSQAAIELHDVVRTFNEGGDEGGVERVVLHGIDLRIEPGETVALLGRSGSGKSTLLNLVAGLDRPTRGRVVVAGREVSAMSETERTLFRRDHIGIVFQFFNLVPTLTVRENVLLHLDLAGRATAEARERALGLLGEVGLRDRADAFPELLSGGEQQRIAIAAALAHGPALVVADEPTGNLDAHTSEIVLDLLDRMVRAAGKTLLVATHSLELARRADRVFRVVDGRLTPATGDHQPMDHAS